MTSTLAELIFGHHSVPPALRRRKVSVLLGVVIVFPSKLLVGRHSSFREGAMHRVVLLTRKDETTLSRSWTPHHHDFVVTAPTRSSYLARTWVTSTLTLSISSSVLHTFMFFSPTILKRNTGAFESPISPILVTSSSSLALLDPLMAFSDESVGFVGECLVSDDLSEATSRGMVTSYLLLEGLGDRS
ncbi:UNVERIFIED_CONTAM: hypothetical protein Sindi_0368300 [Sesamum indicum]